MNNKGLSEVFSSANALVVYWAKMSVRTMMWAWISASLKACHLENFLSIIEGKTKSKKRGEGGDKVIAWSAPMP